MPSTTVTIYSLVTARKLFTIQLSELTIHGERGHHPLKAGSDFCANYGEQQLSRTR